MYHQRKKSSRSLLVCFSISTLLHASAIALLPSLPPPKKEMKIRAVTLIPSSSLPTKKRESRKLKPAIKKKKKKQFEERWEDKKQVYVPPSATDEAPEDSKYISEHNTKTKRETKSRHAVKNPQTLANEVTAAKPRSAPMTDDGKASPEISLKPKGEDIPDKSKEEPQLSKLEIPTIKESPELSIADDPSGVLQNKLHKEGLKGNSQYLRLGKSKEGGEPTHGVRSPVVGRGGDLNLVPDMAQMARIAGAPDLQLLDEVEEGEGTFLNSSAFKYGSFFKRVRQLIGNNWHPIGILNQRDPTGNVYGRRDRITVVKIILDKEGKVRSVVVGQSSGLKFLDTEALRAVRRAGSFPNVPSGLIGDKKFYSFKFKFHLRRDFSQSRIKVRMRRR